MSDSTAPNAPSAGMTALQTADHHAGAPQGPADVKQDAKDASKLPPFFSLLFSTRAASLAVSVIVLGNLTFYATDIVGVPSAVIGTLFLVARILDAVTDLVINVLIDKTRSRWGKARPYELFIVPIWLAIVAVFSTPDMAQGWQLTYIFVMYWLITSVCQTALNASEPVFLKRAVDGEERYAKVLSRQSVFLIIVAGAASVMLPQLIALWGDTAGGWTLITAIYAVPMMLIGLVRFVFVKERAVSAEETSAQRPTFKEVLRAVVRNKYAFYLGALLLLGNVVVHMGTITGTYFFKYIFGDIGLLSIVSLGAVILPFTFLLFPRAVRTIGAMNFVRIGLAIAICGYMLVFIAPTSLPLAVTGTILGGFGAILTMLVGFFRIQVMVYGQWKTGPGIEAGPQMVTGVAEKFGMGIAPALVGGLLAVAGYNGALDIQPASADTMIIALYSLVPATLCAAILALSFVWKLDKRMDAVKTDVENGVTAESSTITI